MPHILLNPESYIGNDTFKNAKGNHECVEFIHQTLNAPATGVWKEGKKVQGDLTIAKGTAIATFVNGKYPQAGTSGKHAAIYLSQDVIGIWVVDQWNKQGKVEKRQLRFATSSSSLSNDGKAFSVIEW
jgi:hypothetical protein